MSELHEDFINFISNEKRFSSHTVRAYSNDLAQFRAYCLSAHEALSILNVQPIHIRSWIISLIDQGISSRSVTRKISTLKSFYKFLIREGHLTINPVQHITSPKISKKLPEFVNQPQMDMLLDKVEFGDDFSGLRDRLILEMLYHTGVRLNELITLKDVNVDITQQQIKVLGKRNKERIIPFAGELRNTLSRYKTARKLEFNRNMEFLFCTDTGTKLYPKFVYRVVGKYLSSVTSLSKTSPHVLRHTFATHMLNNGADINAIKEILGHANLAATQVYTHNSFKKLKSIYNKAHPRA